MVMMMVGVLTHAGTCQAICFHLNRTPIQSQLSTTECGIDANAFGMP